jgi:putative restriction endonuclease
MKIAFNQWKSGATRAPHKPLLFLLALGQWQQGHKSFTWTFAEPILTNLLHRFGRPAKKQTPENPWARLQADDLWVLNPAPILMNGNYSAKNLTNQNSEGSLSQSVQDWLIKHPEDLIRWTYEILDEQFPPSQHVDILNACGISTYETAVKTKRKRNPGFASDVLRNYGNRCAVCGYHLQIDQQTIGLEAAHIQWHAFEGPDTVDNGLALCSLHHKLFDYGAFGLSDDYSVLVSQKVNGNSVNDLAKFHGAQLLIHPIDFVNPKLEFIRWQRKEVLK